MTDDAQLLSRFTKRGDEAAFGELVTRHLDLVYSAALRQLNGDAHLAEDVIQTVFTDLARKARSLPRDVMLNGWLYEAARFAAAKAVRGEQRRRAREQEAAAMYDPTPETTPDWEQLRPVLDSAMGELSATDRNAVLLRFFERKDFRAVGAALGLSEDAAQKRVARALEKLRTKLTRHGVTLSASALAAAITGGAVHSAPAGLAASVAAASLAGASAAAATGFATSCFQAMTTMKLKLLAGALAAAAVGTPLVMQHRAVEALRAENAALREQTSQLGELEQLRAKNQGLVEQLKAETARPKAEIEELVRLRGQVTLLREAAEENVRLKAERDNLAKRVGQASERVTNSAATVKLYTRVYKLEPGIFAAAVERFATPVSGENAASGTAHAQGLQDAGQSQVSSNPDVTLPKAVRDFFAANGVQISPESGKSVFFNDRQGTLLVRATLQDLDMIGSVLQAINAGPPPSQPRDLLHVPRPEEVGPNSEGRRPE